jgi:hypothetical protein
MLSSGTTGSARTREKDVGGGGDKSRQGDDRRHVTVLVNCRAVNRIRSTNRVL